MITPPERDSGDAISYGPMRRNRTPQPERTTTMQARLKNPALTVPSALEAAQKLGASATTAGIPETTLYLQCFAGLFGRES